MLPAGRRGLFVREGTAPFQVQEDHGESEFSLIRLRDNRCLVILSNVVVGERGSRRDNVAVDQMLLMAFWKTHVGCYVLGSM